jgi:hypothetical protein
MAPSAQGVCEMRQHQVPATTVSTIVPAIEEGSKTRKLCMFVIDFEIVGG